MSIPSEGIYDTVKAALIDNVGRYMDKYAMDPDDANPLAHITPNEVDDFFGPKVCHIICIVGLFTDWDWPGVEACMTRLISVYPDFAKYEAHFIIDADCDVWQSAGTSDQNKTKEEFEKLISNYDANSVGIYYWGPLGASAFSAKVQEILQVFYR